MDSAIFKSCYVMTTRCRNCEAVRELSYPCQCFAERYHLCSVCGSDEYDTIKDNRR